MTLVVQRRVADVLNGNIDRQLVAYRYCVSIRTIQQLVTIAHIAVEFIERTVVAPHVSDGLGISVLNERPMHCAHFSNRRVVRSLIFRLSSIRNICLSAKRHIVGLLCYQRFLSSPFGRIGRICAHIVVIIKERVVVVSEAGFGSAGIGFFCCQSNTI